MKTLSTRSTVTACSLALLLTASCSRAPKGGQLGLEETSTAGLTTETEKVARWVHSAHANLPANPTGAAADLAQAEDGLDHLLTYYLPLLEAREQAYNAFRHYQLGSTQRTQRELDDIEALLTKVANSGHGHLLREMKEPLEHLEDARAALQSDTDDADESLRALATRLDFLLLRGGLVLTNTE